MTQAGLSVGIDFYPNPDDYVPGCTADAAAVRDFFRWPRGRGIGDLALLENGYASRDAVLEQLHRVGSQLREAPLDRFVMYFAGHLSPAGLVCAEEEVLELWELGEAIARIPARRRLLILDGCFAGRTVDRASGAPLQEAREAARAQLEVLTAACPGLRVMTAVDRDRAAAQADRRGPFTQALLEAASHARPMESSDEIDALQVFQLAYDRLADHQFPLPLASAGLETFPFVVG